MEYNWYIIQATSGSENKIKNTILERAKRHSIGDHFNEIIVPTTEKYVVKNGKKTIADTNMRLGYMFINMVMTDETWQLVTNIPRVFKFLGKKNSPPTIVPKKEVDSILEKVKLKAKADIDNIELEVGSNVNIKEGPFESFIGKVERIEKDKSKVYVLVEILGREITIELSFSQVKKV